MQLGTLTLANRVVMLHTSNARFETISKGSIFYRVGHDAETVDRDHLEGKGDLVALGHFFIANSDLVEIRATAENCDPRSYNILCIRTFRVHRLLIDTRSLHMEEMSFQSLVGLNVVDEAGHSLTHGDDANPSAL